MFDDVTGEPLNAAARALVEKEATARMETRKEKNWQRAPVHWQRIEDTSTKK